MRANQRASTNARERVGCHSAPICLLANARARAYSCRAASHHQCARSNLSSCFTSSVYSLKHRIALATRDGITRKRCSPFTVVTNSFTLARANNNSNNYNNNYNNNICSSLSSGAQVQIEFEVATIAEGVN